MSAWRWGVVMAWSSLVAFAASPAAADEKTACIGAHESGQVLRLQGRWRDARASFRACSQAACPQPVVEACIALHDELAAKMPSIVLRVSDPEGHDTIDASLTIDGVRVADRIPSTALDVDPGERRVRVDHPGWTPIEQAMVVREAERERPISLRFAPAVMPREETHAPLLSLTLFGVSVVAAGVAIPFGLVGKVKEDQLAGSPCGKNGTCSPSEVNGVARDYWTAGIAGGLGVVALGLGVWQLVTARGAPPRSLGLPVQLRADGVSVVF